MTRSLHFRILALSPDIIQHRLPRWALAPVFVGVAFVIQSLFFTESSGVAYILFYPAIVLTAWLCGFGPGLLSAFLGSIAGNIFFIPPRGHFSWEPTSFTAMVLAFAMGCLMVALVAGYRDLVDRLRAAETDLKERADQLARSNAELERFAYVASHDLKEPLRNVTNLVELLERRHLGKLGRGADETIAFIVGAVARMRALIDDLLEYSRAGQSARPAVSVESHEALSGAIESLSSLIRESEAEIQVEDLPTVVADPVQLSQLFQNLLSNALKYRGLESPRIRVASEQRNGSYIFSVKDNGIGIEPQYFEKIFELFQRLHGKNEYGGTGIGLSICKRIVQRHGGEIWVESQPGRGSTFFFSLPRPTERV